MNKQVLSLMLSMICAFSLSITAGEAKKVSFGLKVMFGGRYDNIRMCVASDTGVKGGIIADIMLNTRIEINDNATVTFELPVMRPILFAFAFKMLQFEPEFTFEFRKKINDDVNLIFGPGIGVSFHYGPDYHSDKKNRGDSFFAAGPFISGLCGFQFTSGRNKMVGLRAFYAPLFSGESELSPGTILGGVLEGHFDFK